MAEIERDDQFYMTLVTVQVENCLFRIPRRSLESQSKVFRDMFSLPVSGDAEGSSDNNPIRLEGITRAEFKRFLEILFTGVFEETEEPHQNFDKWLPVLKLARMWECDTIFKYAIKHMPYEQVRKTSAEKVGLAFQYDIRSWILPGLNELARRREPLGDEDLALLGVELTLKVAAIRESLAVSDDSDHDRATNVFGQPTNAFGQSTSAFGQSSSNIFGQPSSAFGRHVPAEHRPRPKLTSGSRDASMVDFTPVIKRVFRIADDGTEIGTGQGSVN